VTTMQFMCVVELVVWSWGLTKCKLQT